MPYFFDVITGYEGFTPQTEKTRSFSKPAPKANGELPDRIGALAVFLFVVCSRQLLGAQAEAISSGEKAAGTSLKQA